MLDGGADLHSGGHDKNMSQQRQNLDTPEPSSTPYSSEPDDSLRRRDYSDGAFTETFWEQGGNAHWVRVGIAAVSLIAIVLAMRSIALHHADWREEQTVRARDAAEQRRLAQLPPAPPVRPVAHYRNLFRMTPTTKRLDALPNGVSFRADFETINSLKRLLYGDQAFQPSPPSETGTILIETNPTLSQAPWQVVRLGGTLYLRCWSRGRIPEESLRIAAAAAKATARRGAPGYPTAQQQQEAQVDLYNAPDAAKDAGFASNTRLGVTDGSAAPSPQEKLTQITIPFNGFGGNYSASSSGTKATISTLVSRLDKHAYEPWKPLPTPDTSAGGGGGSGGDW